MRSSVSVFVTKSDASAREIVWRDGDRDAIAGENANAKLPHLPGSRGQQPMSVVEVDAEHGAGKTSCTIPSSSIASSFIDASRKGIGHGSPSSGYRSCRGCLRALSRARCAAFDLSLRASLGFTWCRRLRSSRRTPGFLNLALERLEGPIDSIGLTEMNFCHESSSYRTVTSRNRTRRRRSSSQRASRSAVIPEENVTTGDR